MKTRVVTLTLVGVLTALTVTAAAAARDGGAGPGIRPPSRPLPAVAPAAVTVSQLPCPTSYGSPETPPPVGPTTTVPIPTALRSELVAYQSDVVVVLAPPSWKCKGAVGADGSWLITLAGSGDTRAIVRAQGAGACYGCALDIAASRFPRAARLLRDLCGSSACVPARPKGEIAAGLGPDVVYFEDLPTSKAPYRTRGVAVFQNDTGTHEPFALEATCSLPSRSVYLCQPILAAFLAEFGVKAHW